MNPDKLYDFQQRGVDWIASKRTNNYGFSAEPYHGLIGDEMGLGKTAQALMAIRELLNSGKKGLFLVPGSTIIQWQKNFEKWVLDGEIDDFGMTGLFAIHGSKSPIPFGMNCIMSHNLLAKKVVVEKLAGANFDFIVIDEVHKFGSDSSKKLTHLWALINLTETHFESGRIALSGTPVRNYAKEIYNIAHFIDPLRFRTKEDFARKYLTYDRKALWNPHQFHADFAPYYIRRTVSEVQKDLPAIRRTKLYTPITDPFIAKAYNKQLDLMSNFMNNAGKVDAFSLLGYLVRLRHITGIAKAKEPSIIEPIREYLTEGGPDGAPSKVVIGIHHHFVADRLKKSLSEFTFFEIVGGQSMSEREKIKQEFISCSAPAICLLSIKAAGEGIDGLQFASNKIYTFERQWNPADEEQFEKRVHRNGQKFSVQSEITIAQGTVDEFFDALVELKRQFKTQVEDPNFETNPAFLKQLAEIVIANPIKIVQSDIEDFEKYMKPKRDIGESLMVPDFEV